jgi:hypothetical protein
MVKERARRRHKWGVYLAIVFGTLNARLLADGTVETWLTPDGHSRLRPLLAKSLDTAEQDFIRTYCLTPAQAAAFRAQIEREGSASIAAAV